MRPHNSHSSRENATPSSGTSPIGSCKGVPPREKGGGVFNLEKIKVSVLQKELKYIVEKLKNKKIGGHTADPKDQNQVQTSSW